MPHSDSLQPDTSTTGEDAPLPLSKNTDVETKDIDDDTPRGEAAKDLFIENNAHTNKPSGHAGAENGVHDSDVKNEDIKKDKEVKEATKVDANDVDDNPSPVNGCEPATHSNSKDDIPTQSNSNDNVAVVDTAPTDTHRDDKATTSDNNVDTPTSATEPNPVVSIGSPEVTTTDGESTAEPVTAQDVSTADESDILLEVNANKIVKDNEDGVDKVKTVKHKDGGDPVEIAEIANADQNVNQNGTSKDAFTVPQSARTCYDESNRVIPSNELRIWTPDAAIKLRMADKGPASRKPLSVPYVFHQTVSKHPNHTALRIKKNGSWHSYTFQNYLESVRKTAKAFMKLGLLPHHSVGILGFNSPEWFYSNLGAIFAGGIAAGIYTTNSPEACKYVADNCKADIIVCEDDKQVQKIIKVRDQLPNLKAIIQWSGELTIKDDDTIMTFEDMLKLSSQVSDEALDERIRNLAVNQCCLLIYTSGTTGTPKGVMLSHDNITWTARTTGDYMNLRNAQEHVVSYLPLSHIAAEMVDIYAPITFAATVHFAEPSALKGTLGETLREVRPTAFIGVPRVWEKIGEQIKAVGASTQGLKKKIATWAKGIGLRGNKSRLSGGSVPWGFGFADKLVFRKVRAAIGLDRCHVVVTAAAPIMNETVEYFLSLNIELCDLFGMSESSGPHSTNRPGNNRLSSSGLDLPGATTHLVQSALDDPESLEICMEGRHVMMGYLQMEEKTCEALDDKGFLHSGDLGRKDKDGYLFITGRLKEILITAGGENVAPIPIEDRVKTNLSSIVSNAMLIGDKRKFLSMLLTLKSVPDHDTGYSTDQLANDALAFCNSLGSHSTKVSDVLNGDEPVLKAIQDGIDKANKESLSRAQTIQKWSLLPHDFTIPGGELGPTMKLKRAYVDKKYADTIEEFYLNAKTPGPSAAALPAPDAPK